MKAVVTVVNAEVEVILMVSHDHTTGFNGSSFVFKWTVFKCLTLLSFNIECVYRDAVGSHTHIQSRVAQ